MELFAREQGIPLDYLDKFLEDIKATGYTFLRHDGIAVPIRPNNFRALLGKFWRSDKRQEARDAAREKNRAQQPMKHADNWIGSRPDQLEDEPI